MTNQNDFVVFISYSHLDANLQLPLELAIGSLPGVRVWSDHQIGFGEDIFVNIKKAIGESDCVLVLLTESSVRSPEVREELVRADMRGLPIIVLKEAAVEDKKIPYFLRDRRYLSFDQGGLNVRQVVGIVQRAVLDVRERTAASLVQAAP